MSDGDTMSDYEQITKSLIGRRQFMRAAALGAGAVLLGPTLLAACDSNEEPEGSANGEAQTGGTLLVSITADIPDYDILQAVTYLTVTTMAPVYSQLVRFNPADSTEVIGDLAESWEQEDDTTYVFNLHDGVRFHGGTELSAEDIEYSLRRIQNPPTGILSPRRSLLANVADIETPDALTVVVRLTAPQPDFLHLLATPHNVIYPKAVAEPLDETGEGMREIADGTGPFKLGERVEGEFVRLDRNEDFFREGEPLLDAIEFYPIPAGEQTAAAITSERIHACWFLPSPPITESLNEAEGITAETRPMPIFVNLIPNMSHELLSDVRVRQAISLAIDRAAFVETLGPVAGVLYTGRGLFPPGSPYSLSDAEVEAIPGYDTQEGLGGSIAANQERARQLVQEVGLEDVEFELVVRADIPATRDPATFVAQACSEVGINISVSNVDVATITQRTADGDFDLTVESVALGGVVPDNVLGEGYTSFGGRNYGGWVDDEIDELYRRQSVEQDPERRAELIREFQQVFMNSLYQINLGFVGYGYAHQDVVKGWNPDHPTLYSNMTLSTVYLET